MGCKQSKGAVRDESPEYKDGRDRYEDPDDIEAMMYGRNGIETEIIQSHRYEDGYGGNSQQQLALSAPANQGYCNDQHYTKMAESCTAGILEMFQFNNPKQIANEQPPQVSAYQHPAYNYKADNSIGHNSQTSSQRRAVIVQQGSFQL